MKLTPEKAQELHDACRQVVAELCAGERTEEGAEAEIQSICAGFCEDDCEDDTEGWI